MRINIATSHRFHLLDLARELSYLGHDVQFYSYVPTKRCMKFGLNGNQCHCLLPFLIPILVLQKMCPHNDFLQKCRCVMMDYYMSFFMRPCDIYIALGTVYEKSFLAARKRFKAKTILEWGSKHIDVQQQILKSIGAHTNALYWNERSKRGYANTDYIAISSEHVKRSFINKGFSPQRLLVNNYGVDLKMFYFEPTIPKQYDVIMVGGWSKRKGCDLIVGAMRKTNLKFLHVGSIVDMPFPADENFKHIDSVDQTELVKYYNLAKIFLLPSREEGLAMVQAQAISCNLPLVASKDSGAEDLKNIVAYPEYIIIINDYSVDAVIDAINEAQKKFLQLGTTLYGGNAIKELTWEAYGKRYNDNINTIKNCEE